MVLGKAWIIWWSYEEGDYDYLRNSAKDTVSKIFKKVIHFFDKTRWSRMFMRPA